MHTKYGSNNEIWLTFNNETEKIHFPVNPEKFTVVCDGKVDTIDIVGLGEILIKQDRPAMRITWKCFLPSSYFPGMNFKEIYDPYWVANRINGWKEREGVCHLIVTGTPINLYVLVTKYKVWEVGGDVGTVHYEIELREWRNTAPRQIEIVHEAETETAVVSDAEERVDNRSTPQTYTVIAGDSLYVIAKKLLGSGSRWEDIYKANSHQIITPDKIYVGQVLTIPG